MTSINKIAVCVLSLVLTATVAFAQDKSAQTKRPKKNTHSTMEESISALARNHRSDVSLLNDNSLYVEDVETYVSNFERWLENGHVRTVRGEKLVSDEELYAQIFKQREYAGSLFELLTDIFEEEIGGETNASDATMAQYREFYHATKNYLNGNMVLPTIAIWKNKSIYGLVPARHQWRPFWAYPEKVAKMYNTMAEVDHEAALNLLKENIQQSFQTAQPPFPESESGKELFDRKYPAKFFGQFAKAGSWAKKDAPKLQRFVEGLLLTPEERVQKAFAKATTTDRSRSTEERVKKAFSQK